MRSDERARKSGTWDGTSSVPFSAGGSEGCRCWQKVRKERMNAGRLRSWDEGWRRGVMSGRTSKGQVIFRGEGSDAFRPWYAYDAIHVACARSVMVKWPPYGIEFWPDRATFMGIIVNILVAWLFGFRRKPAEKNVLHQPKIYFMIRQKPKIISLTIA